MIFTMVIDVISVGAFVIFVFGFLFRKLMQSMLPEQSDDTMDVTDSEKAEM